LNRTTQLLAVAGLGILFFFPFLGAAHLFDWDEVNFAEAAREMLITGDYGRIHINFQPFNEKPPFFFWLQAASMQIFGMNEYAARFPNAVCGVITLCTLFYLGSRLQGERFGWLWVLGYLGSFTPHLYFKSGIIDPFFNLFIFLSIVFVIQAIESKEKKNAWQPAAWAGLMLGMAILTKGPVALLITGFTVLSYWAWVRKSLVSLGNLLVCGLLAALPTALWLGFETSQYGLIFIEQFLERQYAIFSTSDAGHGQPWFYHPVVLFFGCFPISILALRTFVFKAPTEPGLLIYRRWMLLLFWVVLILFSITTSKIVHYSSMCYFPVSFLAAYHLHYLLEGKIGLNAVTRSLLLVVGLILAFALAALPWIGMHTDLIIPYVDDVFVVGNLQAEVDWVGFEGITGILYGIAVIVAVTLWQRKRTYTAIKVLFGSTAVCLLIYSTTVVPKIEQYTQGAAVRFYESLRGKPVYVNTIGFRSYAQLFYFQKPLPDNPKSYDESWLLSEEVDRDTYFVIKNQDWAEYHKKYPQLQEIKQENGFIFTLHKAPSARP
jgi:4-amino-4-deoxy-L-arabinose transferase-like glycosyltransferase